MQKFRLAKMARDARLNVTSGTARVNVSSSREIDYAQFADHNPGRGDQGDVKLVANVSRRVHMDECLASRENLTQRVGRCEQSPAFILDRRDNDSWSED